MRICVKRSHGLHILRLGLHLVTLLCPASSITWSVITPWLALLAMFCTQASCNVSTCASKPSELHCAQVTQLEEDGAGGFELHGTVRPDAAQRSLGAFQAVVLSDAMAGNPGEPHAPFPCQLSWFHCSVSKSTTRRRAS